MDEFIHAVLGSEELRGLLFFACAGAVIAWGLTGGKLPRGVKDLMGDEEEGPLD